MTFDQILKITEQVKTAVEELKHEEDEGKYIPGMGNSACGYIIGSEFTGERSLCIKVEEGPEPVCRDCHYIKGPEFGDYLCYRFPPDGSGNYSNIKPSKKACGEFLHKKCEDKLKHDVKQEKETKL